MKFSLNGAIAVVTAVLFCTVHSQFAPTWTTSLYIEAKSFSIVTGTQKTSGTYTNTITFSGNFPTPSLALSIPQLRIVSNNSQMNFLCVYSNPTATGFTHTLTISGSNSVVWYLSVRYFVVSLQLLPTTIQAGLINVAPTIISANPGTVRTETFSNTGNQLSFGMNMGGSPICVPFLTGVTGTSVDYYQLNITCAITATKTLTITAIVYQTTLISSLNIYSLVYDPVALAVTSIYFADYTITTTLQGVQTVFTSLPYGYYDTNYMGGLASFSMQDNVEYNNTLSIPLNTTIYSSSTSFYNSVPQLQLRVRNCPPTYPYFNTQNNLCYSLCPSTTYTNPSFLICYPCSTYCSTCIDITLCTVCQSGMILVNGLCTCPLTNYLYGGICYGCDYSCLTCTFTGQFYNCLSCNATNKRSTMTPYPPYNNSCPCDSGFHDVGVAMCQEICGDGVAIVDQCDDANTVDGDGCSSACTIQSNFTCINNALLFSTCYYIGNVTIDIVAVFKDQFSNVAHFFVEVSPWIPLMSQLANSISLTSNGTFISTSYDVVSTQDGSATYLQYSVTYSQPLEDTYLRISLNPAASGVFSMLPPANVTILCTANNGYKLLVYKDTSYTVARSFKYVCLVFGFLILATAPLYIFGRLKWVGNMLFLSLQFQYVNMAILYRFSPMLSGLAYFKNLMGYNGLVPFDTFSIPKYPSFYAMAYNTAFDQNVNFMVIFQALGIVMFIIYYIAWRRNQLICKKYGGDPDKTFQSNRVGKFLQFFNWEFFMFWNLFNITNQILAMILVSEQVVKVSILPLQIFCMICIFLALIPLIIKRDQIPSYTRLLYYKDRGSEEQLVTLGGFAIMYFLLYFSLTQNMQIYYGILIFPIILIVYLFCRKPFQSRWVRAAYFINNFYIIMTLIYNRLTINLGDQVQYLPFGTFIIIVFDWIFNLIVWGRQAYIICKYGGEEGLNEMLQSNTKTTQQNDDFNGFFKPQGDDMAKNNSLLNNILKKNNNNKLSQTSRKVKKQQNIVKEDEPEYIKDKKQRQLQDEQVQERSEITKKRQQWSKEMRQMKQIRQLRQRTRQNIKNDSQKPSNQYKRVIRSTRHKGIDQSRMNALNNRDIRI